MGLEVSAIFHDFFFLSAFLLGILIAFILSILERVPVALTSLLILAATICYISCSGLTRAYFSTNNSELLEIFPHFDKTIGLTGIVAVIIISGKLLRIPVRLLQKLPLVLLIIITTSKLGCIAGSCLDYKTYQSGSYELIHLASVKSLPSLQEIISYLYSHMTLTTQLIVGFFGLGWTIYLINKFRRPWNLLLLTIFILLSNVFISLFYVKPFSSPLFSQRILGMDLIQWALLLINMLIGAYIIASESNRLVKYPKLKIKVPSYYFVFIFYISLTLITLKVSDLFSRTDPFIFLSIFMLTTFLLIIYLYNKIQQILVRYSVVVIILIAGVMFIQAKLITPKIDIIPDITPVDQTDTPVKSTELPENYKAILTGYSNGYRIENYNLQKIDSIKPVFMPYNSLTGLYQRHNYNNSDQYISVDLVWGNLNGRKPRYQPGR